MIIGKQISSFIFRFEIVFNIIIICQSKINHIRFILLLRLFHITIVTAYFFCTHAGIIGAPYISTINSRSINPLNKPFPASPYIITPGLSRHIVLHSQIKIESAEPITCADIERPLYLLTLYSVKVESCPFKTTLKSPLNKAPPIFIS